MKKLFAVVASLLLSANAFAVDANAVLNGSLASSCTIVQASAGTLGLSGNTITTTTPAVMAVQNNDANVYKIRATDAGDFSSKPGSYSGTATLTTTMSVTGSNPGSVASGGEHNLVNTGNDTVNVSVGGTANQNMVAGAYGATAVVSCIAQ